MMGAFLGSVVEYIVLFTNMVHAGTEMGIAILEDMKLLIM